MRNDFFTPRAVAVRKGGVVTWTWQSDGRPHNVSGPGFASAILSQGAYRRTFPKAGVFRYVLHVARGHGGVGQRSLKRRP